MIPEPLFYYVGGVVSSELGLNRLVSVTYDL